MSFLPGMLLAQSGTPARDTTSGRNPVAVFVPPVLLGVPETYYLKSFILRKLA